ncbi:DUF1441 family protein [Vibrio splendidus]|uniref:DUF1441 family protein n=1 Tax=Vibrio splendidus TaxID=29497 RepID=UPI000C84A453|nr:DUF1441 family protein [Vibrio splendidus]PMI49561.1 hypothetical protein BCU42_14290 [Vibrio splendidus]
MNNEKRLWNLTELEAFNYHRSTIRKKLKAAGIEPVAFKGQTPLYDVVQIAPYLCQAPVKETDAPDLMGFKTAAELRAFVQAEREKLALQQDAEHLVPTPELESQLGLVIASMKSFAVNAITRIETAIPSVEAEELELLEDLFNKDLKQVCDEVSAVPS